MSVLALTHKFAAAHLGHRFPIWASVGKELRMVMGLLFTVETDLSQAVNSEVHVGDSSDRGYSLMTCSATVQSIKREFLYDEKWRFLERPVEEPPLFYISGTTPFAGERRNTTFERTLQEKVRQEAGSKTFGNKRNRIFGKPLAGKSEAVEAYSIPHICSGWSDSTRWTLVAAKAWQDPHEHINTKEAKVCLMAIRRLSRTTYNLGKCNLLLSDSMVSILALSKGRSSAFGMNRVCRRAAAYLVGGSMSVHLRHTNSTCNPADGPSRWFGMTFLALSGRPTAPSGAPSPRSLGGGQWQEVITTWNNLRLVLKVFGAVFLARED